MKKFFLMMFVGTLAVMMGCADKTVELSDEEQLKKDIATIDAWLAANNISALTDPSGLRYVITTAGTGAKPKITNAITAKYVGKLLKEGVAPASSSIFDQGTLQPSTSCTCRVQDFIKGWQIGLPLLPKGSKATFYIPSGLGYGKVGAGSSIPGNANLFFDVELIDFK